MDENKNYKDPERTKIKYLTIQMQIMITTPMIRMRNM